MKRLIYIILLIILVFLLSVAFYIKPIILSFSNRQLKNIFPGSTVTVKSCDFRPLHLIALSGIDIRKNNTYGFKIREARIEYSLFSIITGHILKFSLRDAEVKVNLGQKNLSQLTKEFNLTSRKRFSLDFLELSNLSLKLNSSNLRLEAMLSLGLDLAHQLINDVDFIIASLEGPGVNLNDACLIAYHKAYPGVFHISRIKYNKLVAGKIRSNVRLEDKSLFLAPLSAEISGGKLEAVLSLQLDKNVEYLVNLKFKDIDLNKLFNDLDLNEKAEISGKIDGALTLKGRGPDIKVISGELITVEGGGVLTIKDNDYLKKMAASSNQSLDILMESFRNYHYNIGVIKLSLDKGNLVLGIALEGEVGKRNLNITLHDFKLRR